MSGEAAPNSLERKIWFGLVWDKLYSPAHATPNLHVERSTIDM